MIKKEIIKFFVLNIITFFKKREKSQLINICNYIG